MVYIANSFSLSMLAGDNNRLQVWRTSPDEVRSEISRGFVSAVGHEATAQMISRQLGVTVPFNRVQVTLCPGDRIFVFQLLARLPEGKVLSEAEMDTIPARWYGVVVER